MERKECLILLVVVLSALIDGIAAQVCTSPTISNTDYRFSDIGLIRNVLTPCACEQQCNLNRYCKVWTHESTNCYIKYGIGYTMPHAGRTSGVRTAAYTNLCSTFVATNYVGGDFGGVEAYSLEECCYRCASTTGCHAFSYQTVSTEIKGYCYFKSSNALNRITYPSITSGAVLIRAS